MSGTSNALDGDLSGDLLEGHEERYCTRITYGRTMEHTRLRPGSTGGPGSVMEIRVNAVEHGLLKRDKPLVWSFRGGTLYAADDWDLALTVPAVRPAVLKPDIDFSLGGLGVRLEEVWLGRTQTLLLFGGDVRELDLLEGLRLEDHFGSVYRPIPDAWDPRPTQFAFEPIPASADRLVVKCKGAGIRLRGKWRIPLEAGASGSPVDDDRPPAPLEEPVEPAPDIPPEDMQDLQE